MQAIRTVYLESSALLRVLLEGDLELGSRIGRADRLVTSTLTLLECWRSLDLATRTGRVGAAVDAGARGKLSLIEERSILVPIDDELLLEARQRFPVEPVRSLDAIHLASILLWSKGAGPLAVASCDARVRANARAFGCDLLPDS